MGNNIEAKFIGQLLFYGFTILIDIIVKSFDNNTANNNSFRHF